MRGRPPARPLYVVEELLLGGRGLRHCRQRQVEHLQQRQRQVALRAQLRDVGAQYARVRDELHAGGLGRVDDGLVLAGTSAQRALGSITPSSSAATASSRAARREGEDIAVGERELGRSLSASLLQLQSGRKGLQIG